MSLVKNAMVANLQVGLWTGYRLDMSASAKVTKDAGAESDAARVNKHLVPKETLKPVQSAAGAVRLHFYDKTLPWKDNGDRLLTRKMYQAFIEEHMKLRSAFETEVDHFLSKTYLQARERASFRMGDMFKAEDYPKPAQLRPRFYINLDIDAITEAGDFRVALDKEALASARKDIEEAMQERVSRAMGDVWTRLQTTLGHFADRMKGDEKFKEATVLNLEELVNALPALNFMDDPNLHEIHGQLAEKIIGISAEDIRGDKKTRKTLAKDAKAIMADVNGFMKAFGGVK